MVYDGDEQYYRVSLRKYDEGILGSRLTCSVDVCCEDYKNFCRIVDAVNKIYGDEGND